MLKLEVIKKNAAVSGAETDQTVFIVVIEAVTGTNLDLNELLGRSSAQCA